MQEQTKQIEAQSKAKVKMKWLDFLSVESSVITLFNILCHEFENLKHVGP